MRLGTGRAQFRHKDERGAHRVRGLNLLVPEAGLEPAQGCPYRILSLVADATKARRVCKPSVLMIDAIGALAFHSRTKHGQQQFHVATVAWLLDDPHRPR